MFKVVFFPSPSKTLLDDIKDVMYPQIHHCPTVIIKEEIQKVIQRPETDKVSGPDGISNRILQVYVDQFTSILTYLFSVYLTLKYHPQTFRETRTLTLRKSNKSDYSFLKIYRSIVLFNIMDKTLESIIVRRITYLTKKYNVLLKIQMRTRNNRSTETALELLIEQVHTI